MALSEQQQTQMMETLGKLSILADEAIAQKIVEKMKLHLADRRVDLFECEGIHMCARPACQKPAADILIFKHCREHLNTRERKWLEKETIREILSLKKAGDADTDALARWGQLSREHALEEKSMRNNRKDSEHLFAEAEAYIREDLRVRQERSGFLPGTLNGRIIIAWEKLFQSVGFNDPETSIDESPDSL